MSDLSGALLKIEHAESLMATFTSEHNRFIQNEPFFAQPIENEDGSIDFVFRSRIMIPKLWAAQIGDIIHSTKTALDYMAYELIRKSNGDLGKNIYFPINKTSDQSKFESQLNRQMSDATDAIKEYIRSIKPYKTGNDILVNLHQLDIADKHKELYIVAGANPATKFDISMDVPWQKEKIVHSLVLRPATESFPLRDGDKLGGIGKDARKGSFEEDANTMQFGIYLAFCGSGDSDGLPILPTASKMILEVRKIIENCHNLFYSKTSVAE